MSFQAIRKVPPAERLHRGRKPSTTPTLTISSDHKKASFNSAAKYLIADVRDIAPIFDEASHTIGIVLLDGPTRDSWKLSKEGTLSVGWFDGIAKGARAGKLRVLIRETVINGQRALVGEVPLA